MRVGVPPGLRLACWPVADPDVQPRVTAYARGTDEYSRVLAFSDAVFAIAMTLLVVGIAVPTLADADSVHDLADALNDLVPNFVSFFIRPTATSENAAETASSVCLRHLNALVSSLDHRPYVPDAFRIFAHAAVTGEWPHANGIEHRAAAPLLGLPI